MAGSAGSAGRPTAAKSEPAKRRNGKTTLPPGIIVPPEGTPGTLGHMLQQNAAPPPKRQRTLKPKPLIAPAGDDDDDEDEQEPEDGEEELTEEQERALFGPETLRDQQEPPGQVQPPSRVSTSASAASGVSDTEAAPTGAAPSGPTSALAKKFHSHANYHATDKFINEAMAMYKAATKEEKHKILAQFATDKSCKWIVSVKESHKTEQSVTSNALDGWMTEFEIADLNKLPMAHPNYRRLLDALLKDLPSMEHPKEEWRNDTKLYQYHHEGPLQTKHSQIDGRVLESSADLSKTAVVRIEVKKEHMPHKVLFLEIKTLKLYEKKINTQMQAGRTLAAQLSARSQKIPARIITDGLQTLTTFLNRVLESLVIFEDMANTHQQPDDDLSGCINDARAMKSNCATHTKAFKALLDKFGPKKPEQQKEEEDQ